MILVPLVLGGAALAAGIFVFLKRKKEANPTGWQLGPVIDGIDYTRDLPRTPPPAPDGLWYFIMNANTSSVHYATTNTSSIAGKSAIYMKFRVDIPDGVVLYGTEGSTDSSTAVVPYFERQGDNWSGTGAMETYRWWNESVELVLHDKGGTFEITAPLAGPGWKAVETKTYETASADFEAAKQNAGRIGFTFANGTGAGHGASATGTVKFTLLEWRVS